MAQPIGALVGGRHLLCLDCANNETRHCSPVYKENLDRYTGRCHACGEVFHDGSFMVQLFDAVNCLTCIADVVSIDA